MAKDHILIFLEFGLAPPGVGVCLAAFIQRQADIKITGGDQIPPVFHRFHKRQDRAQEAVELLDMGLEKLPPSQIRFTDSNTYPFLEAYYAASAMGVEDAADKGDALLREYARTLIEYIEYYLRFDGVQGDMVSPIIDEKLDQLGDVYYLAVYAGRKEIIGEINAYYRSLGVEEENLVDVGDKPHQVDTTLIPRKDTAQ